ncbi:MAG: cytochrome c3 family protein [Desulfuromonadales bacterium]
MRRFDSFWKMALLLAAVGLAACAPAGQKGASKGCLDCHQEYASRFAEGNKHQPVAMQECGACHRNHGLIGGLYLKREVPELCFDCHAEINPARANYTFPHPPTDTGQCLVCHDPHNAKQQALLKDTEEALCLTCHDAAVFAGQHRHAPLAKGCKTCHQVHGSQAPDLLSLDKEALCASCHDLQRPVHREKHGGYAIERGCTDCHSAHTSDRAPLLKASVHKPVKEGTCGDCHDGADLGSDGLPAADKESSCYSCHGDKETEFSAEDTHAVVREGRCRACHAPHASDSTFLVSQDEKTLCFGCHTFRFNETEGQQSRGIKGHSPVAGGDCLSCHSPHRGSVGQNALLAASPDRLCSQCHDTGTSVPTYSHPPMRQDGCLACHQPHESTEAGLLVKPQRSLCADCHESVRQAMNDTHLHRPFLTGRCDACHNPHGGDRTAFLKGEGAQTCAPCHPKLEAQRRSPGWHVPFTAGQCRACHQPHSSDQAFLLTGEVSAVCLQCHPGQQPAAGMTDKHQNCASCHAPHGNEGDHFLLKSLPELCLTCHKVDQFWEQGAAHAPAAAGQCTVCHDPHFSRVETAFDARETCFGCHNLSPAELTKSHGGMRPGDQTCLECHDPHGASNTSLLHPVGHKPFMDGDCAACHQGGAP